MSEFAPSPKYYSSTQAQKIAAMAAILSAAVSTIMVSVWMAGKDQDKSFLGGLDFQELLFNWHPILMLSGFGFFFTSSIVSFRIMPASKPIQKKFHAFCHVMAIVCISLGLTAVFVGNNDKSKNAEHTYYSNLSSLHSFLGLSAVAVYGQNFFLGLYHFFVSGVTKASRQRYMPIHVFLGILAFVIAFMAAETGIMELSTELGCGYETDKSDLNPAANYDRLTEGCRLANGVGMMLLVTLCLTLYALIGNNDAVDHDAGSAADGTAAKLLRNSREVLESESYNPF